MYKTAISSLYPQASRMVYGCMGLGGDWTENPYNSGHVEQAAAAIDAAMEIGINFFDHADIYTRGKAEQVFGEVLAQRAGLREQLIIQSKCGIRFEDQHGCGRYDWSREHILRSVEQSLNNLKTDYLDILLLHRPDPLADVHEVAEVFEQLRSQGVVKHFGVSNMQAAQMAYLQSVLPEPLVANQLELSLSHLDWLEQGIGENNGFGKNLAFTPGTLEYCAQHKVQIQAWGSLSQGRFSGRHFDDASDAERHTAELVARYADELGASREAVVLAWLMRHPVGIQPVIGSANVDRIKACAGADQLELSREQWYQLYVSSRGNPLP
ncbi:aldo/keto reductase [Aliagarivorans taiwanensis]|uniref:aldo/keto reductase n=1 Tax=Aliagarivorans taiwanensis TaxID=561966 RepID=UPI0003FA7818|nr:aldo/keto reductase [Aliagarivorans taiwanensis]